MTVRFTKLQIRVQFSQITRVNKKKIELNISKTDFYPYDVRWGT